MLTSVFAFFFATVVGCDIYLLAHTCISSSPPSGFLWAENFGKEIGRKLGNRIRVLEGDVWEA